MRLRTRVRQDPPADVPAAGESLLPADPASMLAADDLDLPIRGHLELPAPARLALTAGWNLAESLGLPLLAYAVGARLGGQGGAFIGWPGSGQPPGSPGRVRSEMRLRTRLRPDRYCSAGAY